VEIHLIGGCGLNKKKGPDKNPPLL